jgi:hypothetical protein
LEREEMEKGRSDNDQRRRERGRERGWKEWQDVTEKENE